MANSYDEFDGQTVIDLGCGTVRGGSAVAGALPAAPAACALQPLLLVYHSAAMRL